MIIDPASTVFMTAWGAIPLTSEAFRRASRLNRLLGGKDNSVRDDYLHRWAEREWSPQSYKNITQPAA